MCTRLRRRGRLAVVQVSPEVLDYFTPFNQGTLNGNDADLGSGGVLRFNLRLSRFRVPALDLSIAFSPGRVSPMAPVLFSMPRRLVIA